MIRIFLKNRPNPSLRVALKAPRSNLRENRALLDVVEIASSGEALLAMAAFSFKT